MRLDAVTVLYRPTAEDVANILQYAPLFHRLFLLDNSEQTDEAIVRPLQAALNAVFLSMGGNRGIAAALRKGMALAAEDGADFCLTMDQDSVFPTERMPQIVSYLAREDADEYGIIALNINGTGAERGLVPVKVWITSGNFVNMKNYAAIDGFREELFIDSVDFDLDRQFHAIGKKIAYIGEISLRHKIGAPVRRKFLGRAVTVTNHSPVRCYYRFRNNDVLYHEDKTFYRDIYRADRKQLWKILLFEKEKFKKWKMIRLGIRHAKRRQLGPLPTEDSNV